MWHTLLLFTSARPVAEFPSFLKNFNLNCHILMVSDKEVRKRNEFGNLIPLCSSIHITIDHSHLVNVIEQIKTSKLPLLGIIQSNNWIALTPLAIKAFNPELDFDHANWYRHTARDFLTNKIGEPEILVLFKYKAMQQEVAHFCYI